MDGVDQPPASGSSFSCNCNGMCDSVTGVCNGTCLPGYTGIDCQTVTEIPPPGMDLIRMLTIAAVVLAVVAAVVFFLIVFMLWKRGTLRPRREADAESQVNQPPIEASPSPEREDVDNGPIPEEDEAPDHAQPEPIQLQPAVYDSVFELPIPVDGLMKFINDYKKDPRKFEQEYERIPRDGMGTTVEAGKPGNRIKNRFNDIRAYDHSRVVLQREGDTSSYINANHIIGYARPGIAAQQTDVNGTPGSRKNRVSHHENSYYYNIAYMEETSTADSNDRGNNGEIRGISHSTDDNKYRVYVNISREEEMPNGAQKGVRSSLGGGRNSRNRPSSLYVQDMNTDQLSTSGGAREIIKDYIAAQGPTWSTLEDFIEMIWQQQVNRIVMVTRLIENGKAKCDCYWPEEEDLHIGNYHMQLQQQDQYAHYIIREFTIKKQGEERVVRHFHFTGWPDHGLPDFATSIIDFRHKVRSYDAAATGPMLVHCSAGVGRTGTLIALDYLLDQAKYEGKVDVLKFTASMRLARMKLVQTLDQYVFVYDGLLEATVSKETDIVCAQMRDAFRQLQIVDPTSGKSQLQEQYELLAALRPHSTQRAGLAGLVPENLHKNRTVDIIPKDDQRRVVLSLKEDIGDYINAVFVDGYREQKSFILTQVPLPQTVKDFWRMIWEQNVHCVVLLNQDKDMLFQSDIIYWPSEDSPAKRMNALSLQHVKTTSLGKDGDVIIREFKLSKKGCEKKQSVVQYVVEWPNNADFRSWITIILDVMERVRRRQQQTDNEPVVIQCRDGAELSGWYCTACFLLEKIQIDQEVDVFLAVKQVRASRPPIIRTLEQYKLLHELAIQYLEGFEDYANFR